ncbi:MAG TPA: hypothetical protein VGD04_08280 [Methylophilus sp.]
MVSVANTSASALNSRWLWLALLITLALTIWTAFSPQNKDDDLIALAKPPRQQADALSNPSQNTPTKTGPVHTNVQPAAAWLQQLRREAPKPSYTNLFKVHSWVVAAPSVSSKAKALPPPKPTAPPAPFTYMGKLEDGPNGSKVFLMANNRVYAVSIGDSVDPFWRLDGEDENSLQLTFLPLHLPQVLSKNKQSSSPDAAINSALDSR